MIKDGYLNSKRIYKTIKMANSPREYRKDMNRQCSKEYLQMVSKHKKNLH